DKRPQCVGGRVQDSAGGDCIALPMLHHQSRGGGSCTTSSRKSRKMPSPSSSSTRVKNIWLQILLDYL
ncbi:unnamed protein product, partial [Pylaiella littoralis]